jgi:CDP-glucose 4,6-dehydratase
MNHSFWQGKRVLVTGHTGFKGSWLCLWLSRMGARVSGFSLSPPTEPNLFKLARVDRHVDSTTGDVRDLEALTRCVQRQAPEVIFHLAAQSLVRRSYVDPVGTFATNVLGTVHILEAVRQCASVSVVLNVTSDKCYENCEVPRGYRETDAMGGADPYSGSKGCAELVAAAYRRSFFSEPEGIRLGSARAGNVIGGGDWAEGRIVPDCIRALLLGDTVAVRNPMSVRPWQHVLEPLAGYLLYAQRLWERSDGVPQALNFGPLEEDVRTVSELVRAVLENWDRPDAWTTACGEKLHEASVLLLDSTLARKELEWRPRMSFTQAVAATVKWYRHYKAGDDLEECTLSQIADYECASMDSPDAARRQHAHT